jgi:hypothetical protein
MWIGNSEVYVIFDHVLMLLADDWPLPPKRTETLD